MAEEEARACARCGDVADGPAGGLPVGWSLAEGRRGVAFHCAGCTRSSLRAIEARLDESWWDG